MHYFKISFVVLGTIFRRCLCDVWLSPIRLAFGGKENATSYVMPQVVNRFSLRPLRKIFIDNLAW